MRNVMPMLVIGLFGLLGCNRNPTGWPAQSSIWQQPQVPPQAAQVQDLNRRASELDANNRDLHTQFAQAQQQVQLLRDEIGSLRTQLSETATQLQATQLAKDEAERKMQTLQASTRHRGGATITANSSVRQSLGTIDLPGLEVRADGDVIRITIPADQLFAAGTAQLLPSSGAVLDRVADAILRNYPRQIVAIEGHTDSAPPGGGFSSSHLLAAAQANSVFEQLSNRNRLPPNQLFTLSQGANQPLASNATQAGRVKNRRLELVIYPETFAVN